MDFNFCFSVLYIVQGNKSVEEEMDALKDEYHQRVATLERKVGHYSFYSMLPWSIDHYIGHTSIRVKINNH